MSGTISERDRQALFQLQLFHVTAFHDYEAEIYGSLIDDKWTAIPPIAAELLRRKDPEGALKLLCRWLRILDTDSAMGADPAHAEAAANMWLGVAIIHSDELQHGSTNTRVFNQKVITAAARVLQLVARARNEFKSRNGGLTFADVDRLRATELSAIVLIDLQYCYKPDTVTEAHRQLSVVRPELDTLINSHGEVQLRSTLKLIDDELHTFPLADGKNQGVSTVGK